MTWRGARIRLLLAASLWLGRASAWCSHKSRQVSR
jgi:hypothetical protein